MNYKITTHYLDNPLIKGRVFDVFMPSEVLSDTAIFIVHGGAWRQGSRQTFHEIMEALCNRGYIVASTDYRLNARDAFEQLSDIRDSYVAYLKLLSSFGRPCRVAVYGESAGAHLASLLLCTDPGECGEEVNFSSGWIKPQMGMLQATPIDFLPFEAIIPHFWAIMQDIAGAPYDKEPERYQRLSLKNYIREDNPPIFFLEAELEHLFLSKYTREVADRHNKMGIRSKWKVYKRVEHGFFYELKRDAQLEALEDICSFIENKPIE